MTLNLLNSDLDIQQRLQELEQSDLANLDTVRQEATTNTSTLTALINTKTGDNAATITALGQHTAVSPDKIFITLHNDQIIQINAAGVAVLD